VSTDAAKRHQARGNESNCVKSKAIGTIRCPLALILAIRGPSSVIVTHMSVIHARP
jgi:hypothetical protein